MNIIAYEEQRYIKIYENTLDHPLFGKYIKGPGRLILLLMRSACRSDNHFSPECVERYQQGLICATWSAGALAQKLGMSTRNVRLWADTLEKDGIIKRHNTDGEKTIYEIGYWTPLELKNGSVVRFHVYYFDEVLLAPPQDEEGVKFISGVKNISGGGGKKFHPPSEKNFTQSDMGSDQRGDLTEEDAPAATPTQTRTLGTKDKQALLRDVGSQENSENHAKKTKSKKKERSPADYLQKQFSTLHRALVGSVYFASPQDTDAIHSALEAGITEDEILAAFQFYLENHNRLRNHEGNPRIQRALNPHRWADLYAATKQGRLTAALEKQNLGGGLNPKHIEEEIAKGPKGYEW